MRPLEYQRAKPRRRPRTQQRAFVGAHGAAIAPPRPAPRPSVRPQTKTAYTPPRRRPAPKPARRPTPKQVTSAVAVKRAQARSVRPQTKTLASPSKKHQRAQVRSYKQREAVLKGLRGITKASNELDRSIAKPRGRMTIPAGAGFQTAGVTADAEFSKNALADVKDLAITTPTSLAHLAGTAVTHPKKLPGMLAEPYKQFAKDPVKFASERPLSTVLMLAPGVKLPLRAAGRTARLAGKQSLRETTATLPGTTLKEHRRGSRSAVPVGGEAVRMHGQRRKRAQLTDSELERRVDEHYDWRQQHIHAAQASEARSVAEQLTPPPRRPRARPKTRAARREHQRRYAASVEAGKAVRPTRKPAVRRATRADRRQQREAFQAELEQQLSGARAGGKQHADRAFAKEFGSHWYIDPKSGATVKPKKPAEDSGVIHASEADARKIAEKVPFDAQVMHLEGPTEGVTGGHAVVPKAAAERLGKHKRVGHGGFAGGPFLRTTGRQFRKTVLPFSTKWLAGQAVEGAVRGVAAGVGPRSIVRGKRLMRELERVDPAAAKALQTRAVSGGQFGSTGAVGHALIREAGEPKTLAAEFADTGLKRPAAIATKIGGKPGVRHVRHGYRRYTNFVFHQVNGSIEHAVKAGMLGKAVQQGPLMERRIFTLGDKAIQEAADGLRGSSSQVELARAVDRMYGKYSKFGPSGRDYILHTTPFIPWFLNMGHFLFRVMPGDHPVKTALVADINAATEEWRKRERLSYHGKERVPGFMMGSAPTKAGKFTQLGRYGPFMPGEYASSLGGQFTPQIQTPLLNLAGVDWKGQPLKDPKTGGEASQERLIANALLSLAEATVPGVGQAGRVSGLGEHYVRGQTKKPSVVQGKKIPQGVLDLLNPARPIGTPGERKRRPSGGAKGPGLKGSGGGGAKGPGLK